MASARFLLAGAILFACSIRMGETEDRPRPRQWLAALMSGGALLLGGNGGVVLAERRVPTGLVALLVATVPLNIAVIDRLASGRRLSRRAALGLVLGFGGVALLLGPSSARSVDPLGAVLALLAAMSWAAVSIYSRGAGLPARPLVGTAMQMLCGGFLLAVAGATAGEFPRIHPEAIAPTSLLAFGYLVVFGSIVAFSAYVWLLRTAPISLASTYAYVNPAVAVILGWALLGAAVTVRTLAAGAVIVAALVLVASARPDSARPESRLRRPLSFAWRQRARPGPL